MKALKSLLFAIFIFSAAQLHAQRGVVNMSLQYNYALPLGSFKTDVISKGSPRGFTGDILYGISDKFSVGLGLGFMIGRAGERHGTFAVRTAGGVAAVAGVGILTGMI